jgi:hypothetical protein
VAVIGLLIVLADYLMKKETVEYVSTATARYQAEQRLRAA